ncbi:MAG: ribonuclease D [Alphaproteobacteria bacterium]
MLNDSSHVLIQDTASLHHFCENLVFEPDGPRFITVDTEFIRERTYYPILCLIQVADAEKAVAIDPLAAGLDLTAFWELIYRPDILKVFHACRQDIEIFRHLTGNIPQPLFDTQIAAMVCGFGESVSYETLVKDLLKHDLDKTARFSDWSSRPLRKEQLTYALGDVIHLRRLYHWFAKTLQKNQRQAWLGDEMAALLKPETYEPNLEDLWKRIKNKQVQSLNGPSLTLLKELSMWRETLAQQLDRPRRHVLKDDLLVELAILKPTCLEDLDRLRDPHGKADLKSLPFETLFEKVEQLQQAPTTTLPKPSKPKVSSQHAILLEFLKLLLKLCADEAGVASKLIASPQDLLRIVREEKPDIPALEGWRYELFGKEALAFKAGEKGFAYIKGELCRYSLGGDSAPKA